MAYTQGNGVCIYPDDGSRYGFLVSWEPPSDYLKNGAVRISEIIRSSKTKDNDGWKFRMRSITPGQMEKKRYLKSLYFYPNTLDAIIWAIEDIRKKFMNVGGSMEAEAVAETYQKRTQAKDEDKAFEEFGELAGDDVPTGEDAPMKQETADDEVPF